MSDEKLTVFQALTNVMADVRAVAKDGWNAKQGFNFRGIDAVVNAVGPALRDHCVIVVPHEVTSRYRDVTSTTGKPMRECTVVVKYRIYGPEGDYIDAEVPGESMDTGDKGTPKAMSVALRTMLIQSLCLPTHESDPDSETYERAPADPETESVRTEIREFAVAQKLPLGEVMNDFRDRYECDIRTAPSAVLTAYLETLKIEGLREVVPA